MLLAFDANTVAPAVGGSTFFPLGNYPVEITKTEGKQVNGSQDKGYLQLTLKTLAAVEGLPAGTEHEMRLNIFNDSETAVRIAYAQLSAIMHVTGRKVIQDTQQLVGAQFLAKIGPQIKDGQPSDRYSEVKLVMDFQGNTADKIGQAPAQVAQTVQQTVQQPAATQAQQQPWQGQTAATPPAAPPAYVNGGALPAATAGAPWLK